MATKKVDGIEVEISLNLDRYEKNLEKAERETQDTLKDIADDVKDATDDMADGVKEKMFDACGKIGDALAGITAGVVGFAGTVGGLAFKSVMDLDSAMAQLEASTGATNEQMEEFEEVAKNVYAQGLGEDFEDIAEAMKQVNTQLLLTGDELQATTENALILRDVFEVDVNESIRATDTLMNQFGITSDEAMNVITQGFQNNLDFSGEFIDTINEYSVHFKQLGFDVEDMFSVLLDGAESGAFNLDKIGDAVKEFGIRSKDMSDTTRQAFKDLGLDVEATEKAFAEGGDASAEMFNTIITKIEETKDPLKQNEIGISLFGTMWEDVGSQVILSLNDMSDGFNRTIDSAGQLKETKFDTFESAMAEVKRSIEVGALIPIGEKLLPVVQKLIDWLNNEGIPKILEFADSIGEKLANGIESATPFLEGFFNIVTFVIDNVDWLIPLLVTLTATFKTISIVSQITTILSAFGGVATVVGGIIGLLTSPITLVVAALATLAFVFVKYWDEIKACTVKVCTAIGNFISETWNKIFNWCKEMLMKIINFYANSYSSIFNAGKKIITALWDGCKNVWSSVTSWFTEKINWIKDKLSFWNSSKDQMSSGGGGSSWSSVGNNISAYRLPYNYNNYSNVSNSNTFTVNVANGNGQDIAREMRTLQKRMLLGY